MTESNVNVTKSFPLFGIAVLFTIVLAVANVIGWIHVAWWVVFLPIALAVGISLAMLLVLLVGLAIGFGIYLLAGRSKKSSGHVTPSRPKRFR